MTSATGPAFRLLLRHWRKTRRLSQLALAEDARISIRHLSFLETGRSRPSRDMVRRLAESLDLATADANVLLLSAGYAPAYPADALEPAGFESLEPVLGSILAQQATFPTLVIDENWNIRMRNEAADRLFGLFRRSYRLPDDVAGNALHILCHPDGLRPFMPNWNDYAEPFVTEIEREASMAIGSAAERLRDALHAYPGVSETASLAKKRADAGPPLTMRLRHDEATLSFHTAFTTFALPSALAPRHVRVESLYPADPATARLIDGLAGSPT